MAISRMFDAKTVLILLGLALVSFAVEGGSSSLADNDDDAGVKIFEVTDFGAKGDDKKDNKMEFMKTWQAACKGSNDPAKLVVPEGTFMTAPVVFQGPCKSSEPIIVEVRGTIKATDDFSQYAEDSWFLFENIDSLILTGGGTFHGQVAAVWKYNDCKTNKDCARLPSARTLINFV